MTSANDVATTWQMTSPKADVSRGTLARAGAWQRMAARGGSWRRVTVTPRLLVARGMSDEDEISQNGRSERFLSNGVICGLIGEVEAVVAARQWSLMY